MKTLYFIILLVSASSGCAALADDCSANFNKSGNAWAGIDYESNVWFEHISNAEIMGQVRGLMVADGMDIISVDIEQGLLLAEQRSEGVTRAIPMLARVSADGESTRLTMTIKTEKGMLANAESMRTYLCAMMARITDDEAGRMAAVAGAQAINRDDLTFKDVLVFSREIASEAKGNALAVTARHQNRRYALRGRVDHIQADGADYNVSFQIPKPSRLLPALTDSGQSQTGIACLFSAGQLVNVLTFRKGDRVQFEGRFLRYDDLKRMVWLKDCVNVG